MKPNEIEIELLPGGIVKITSGKVAPAIHAKVEDAVKKLEQSLGDSATSITHLPHAHRGVVHTHLGQGVQH